MVRSSQTTRRCLVSSMSSESVLLDTFEEYIKVEQVCRKRHGLRPLNEFEIKILKEMAKGHTGKFKQLKVDVDAARAQVSHR